MKQYFVHSTFHTQYSKSIPQKGIVASVTSKAQHITVARNEKKTELEMKGLNGPRFQVKDIFKLTKPLFLTLSLVK